LTAGSIFFGIAPSFLTQKEPARNLRRFTRLVGAILLEQHEEWHYGERRYLSETSMRRLVDTLLDRTTHPLPLTA
jgi:hypothetical protein